MKQLKSWKGQLFSLFLGVMLAFFAFAQVAEADPTVRVQPSGDTFATAYVITGETRTYFGNVEGGTPPYEYKWEFSNGGDTSYSAVAEPRFIAIDHLYDTFGTHWARLTVRDSTAAESAATINLQVIAAADDDLKRQKNSAVDRGLRYMYRQEITTGDGSHWPGGWESIAGTGIALIAFENHGHNLQSDDSDIYKKSVEEGIRYLLNNAYDVDLSEQACIGDPEADDGDSDNDGKGVVFSESGSGAYHGELYIDPIAVLAIVNSCDKATAQTRTAVTTDVTRFVNGMTLWDIIVDAKDFLAFAQNEGLGNGGVWYECSGDNSYVGISTEGSSISYFYAWKYLPSQCPGTFTIDWGDGSPPEDYPGYDLYCPDYAYIEGPGHSYAAAGDYVVSVFYEGELLCDVLITVSDGECGASGWRYQRNYSEADNSVSQWPVLALEEARSRWDINVNPAVISELDGWLAFSQNPDSGGFGYTDAYDWVNFAKTGAGVCMLHYCNYAETEPRVQSALGFLDANWDVPGSSDGNLGSYYAMYAFYKGMKYLNKGDLNGRDWEALYTEFLVGDQESDDYWTDEGGWYDHYFATSTALAILAPAIAGLPPVADAGGPYPTVNPGQVVNLDGTGSSHQDPARSLVKWEWDFDAADGLWWDSKATPDAGEGAIGMTATTSYPDVGAEATYTVTLRVTDDSTPPQTDDDIATITVATGNVAPVAVTNGPWAGVPGDILTFDGSASYDPNSCTDPVDPSCLGDSIVSYEWDLDGDGIFNEPGEDGTPVTPGDYSIVTKQFPEPVSRSAVLRVTDSYGLTGTSSAQFNIISIAVVYGQEYTTCFRELLSRFEYRLGIGVMFKNLGESAAENLVMTLTQTPTNLQILKGVSILGDLAPGEEKWTECDPTLMSADIELKFDRRIVPTGEWRWRAEFDFAGKHYVVDHIPPLAP
ncbi:PKD domain-containing protein [candidate division WOR-3 bacterium]|nr:PKD domain-containing protein [candidate division WOR-3 bacterium]